MSWRDWFGRRRREVTRRDIAFFFVAGGLMLVASAGALLENHGLTTGAVTTGVVTQYDVSGREPTVTLRFTTGDGRQVDCLTDHFAGHPRTGHVVQVRYDQEDPADNCAIKGSEGGYGGFIATLILTALLIGYGVRLLRRRRAT